MTRLSNALGRGSTPRLSGKDRSAYRAGGLEAMISDIAWIVSQCHPQVVHDQVTQHERQNDDESICWTTVNGALKTSENWDVRSSRYYAHIDIDVFCSTNETRIITANNEVVEHFDDPQCFWSERCH